MKRIMKWSLLSLMLSMFLCVSVRAASKGIVDIEVPEIETEDKEITAECKISGAGEVTNGKIRITYDREKLKLKESGQGDSLADTMVEINDPITGNKNEGEIVFVFASARPVSIDGTLLQMKFDNAGLKSGEKTEIKVAVEELAAESEELTETAECKNGTVFIGKAADNTDDTPKKTGKTTTGKNSAAGSTSKSGKVKTGDTLKMEEALAAAGISLAVVISGAVSLRKKKRK